MFRLSHEIIDDKVIFTKISLKKELEITFSNLGASVYEILFSDNKGNLENVLITPEKKTWLKERTYAGSIVGPLAGRYETAGTTLEQNRSPLHFHGGSDGWDKVLWHQSIIKDTDRLTILFTHLTSAYEAIIKYTIDNSFSLSMKIDIYPKEEIYLNPTNHMYFNLNGVPFLPITNLSLQLDSDAVFTEIDGVIQSDHLSKVSSNCNYNLQRSLLTLPEINGLNHTYQLTGKHAGVLKHPTNGRQLEFKTTLPCVVIYTFNIMQKIFSKNSQQFPIFSSITFETQYPANDLQLVTFNPSRPYHSETTYTFSILEDFKYNAKQVVQL
ncbi:hypothetical protein [Enterococcus faecalis]|uniref:aldose epimerase family protein n=1 Tax=Enterococcus faecalis TaxID=1351 RepID=UPI0020742182|nr:hypothetical protein [Enterococcus faecalis]MCM6935026.1 hypothetical protein [Enterococcus faecalis]MDF4036153.1 hypothetical protein [Staphylococcus aureus]MDF4248599.1 hypothetical protein [Enterococcus faecalis]